MEKKKYLAEDLYEYIEVIPGWGITCSNCGKEEGGYGELFDGKEILFRKGWRATKDNVYCPECSHKRKMDFFDTL